MKVNFKFSNLCGVVYKQGPIAFSPDGNALLSPIGNRITVCDLVKILTFKSHSSNTLPFNSTKNIATFAISPDASLLITIDEDGKALLVNYHRSVIVSSFDFKSKVKSAVFSPDSSLLAVGAGRTLEVWRAPQLNTASGAAIHFTSLAFAPLTRVRDYQPAFDRITCMDWSSDSKFICYGSRDMMVRVQAVKPFKGYMPATLSGHKDIIVGCYFDKKDDTIYSISRDGALFVWKYILNDEQPEHEQSDQDGVLYKYGRWKLDSKHFFMQQYAKLYSAQFHKKTGLLVVGFDNGVFGLYEMPEFRNIQRLNISQRKINTVTINNTGEWLAFGVSQYGQVLVWEWQSERYILKQQGHYFDMNTLAYSPEGQYIATGGQDAKLKVWNASTGFCFVTFKEHTGAITGVEFSPKGQVLVSCSVDGTVRAFDLIRYRNFRVMTSPQPVQFGCVSIDPSGELVAAGSISDSDGYSIYIWALNSGRLLDVLHGHQGPVVQLKWNQYITNLNVDLSVHSLRSQGVIIPELVSASWDQTVRLWSITQGGESEQVSCGSDVLDVTWRPDGKEVCISTLNGQLLFWNCEEHQMNGLIEGRKDIQAGRVIRTRTYNTTMANSYFTSVAYSSDGRCIIAGGNSRYVIIYDVAQRLLLKKFQISHNRSLDGILDYLNSKDLTEAGPMDMIDHDSEDEEEDEHDLANDRALPGVQSGYYSNKKKRPVIRTRCVRFSPTGRQWSCISTEGLLIYSLDEQYMFDPYQLDVDVTPDNILKTLKQKLYLKALIMSLRLNEQHLIARVYEHIPADQVQFIAADIHPNYLQRLMDFIASQTDRSPHLEYHLMWIKHLFNKHGSYLKEHAPALMTTFRALQKTILKQQEDLAKLCDENRYMLSYLNNMPRQEQYAPLAVTREPLADVSGMEIEEELQEGREQLPGWY